MLKTVFLSKLSSSGVGIVVQFLDTGFDKHPRQRDTALLRYEMTPFIVRLRDWTIFCHRGLPLKVQEVHRQGVLAVS